MSDVDLAYLAGLLDGEAHIGINKVRQKTYKNNGYQLRVAVCITDRSIAEYLHETYGGTFVVSPRKRGKMAYHWSLCANQALDLLCRILPFLRIKKLNAELGILFQETRNKSNKFNKSEETVAWEWKTYEEMRRLNARWGSEYSSNP